MKRAWKIVRKRKRLRRMEQMLRKKSYIQKLNEQNTNVLGEEERRSTYISKSMQHLGKKIKRDNHVFWQRNPSQFGKISIFVWVKWVQLNISTKWSKRCIITCTYLTTHPGLSALLGLGLKCCTKFRKPPKDSLKDVIDRMARDIKLRCLFAGKLESDNYNNNLHIKSDLAPP